MALTPGSRVVLERGRRPAGTVKSVEPGGTHAYVSLDTGSACTFPVSELTELAAQADIPSTKLWPGDIETK